MGFDAVVAPLFRVEAVAWNPPDPSDMDSVLITSANAARLGGEALRRFTELPCYAVGESSAAAAQAIGFRDVRTGPGDGAALIGMMAKDGVGSVFHPCGRDHIPLGHPRIERRIVYAAEPVERLPDEAAAALESGALTLLHSPRAAASFSALVDEAGLDRSRIAAAAISPAAAEAAGTGWKTIEAAPQPRDHALLELAVRLCKAGGEA